MFDDFQAELDGQLDLAGEGLSAPDEMDLAQDREDRGAGESQTETAAATEQEEDLSGEQFVYTMPDGTEFQGTIEEIADKKAEILAAERVQEELAKAKPPEQPKAEEKTAQQEELQIQPVDWSKTGDFLASRMGVDLEGLSDGDRKLLGEIGPALNDALHRTVLTSGYVAQYIDHQVQQGINKYLSEREATTQRETAFGQFVGDAKFSDADITAFQKANPFASTREMAIMGLQLQAERQKATGAGKQVTEAEKKGKQAGAQETLKHLRATGQLRRVAGTGKPGAQPANTGPVARNEGERISAWARKVQELQGSG